jgi:hypothetical protein
VRLALAGRQLVAFFRSSRNTVASPVFRRQGDGVFSVREFYNQKVAKCLFASQQVHTLADKKVFLQLAATYVGLLLEYDLGEDCRYDTTTGVAHRPCLIGDFMDGALVIRPPAPTEAASDQRRGFRVIEGGRDD